jgi:hypothetical protein
MSSEQIGQPQTEPVTAENLISGFDFLIGQTSLFRGPETNFGGQRGQFASDMIQEPFCLSLHGRGAALGILTDAGGSSGWLQHMQK